MTVSNIYRNLSSSSQKVNGPLVRLKIIAIFTQGEGQTILWDQKFYIYKTFCSGQPCVIIYIDFVGHGGNFGDVTSWMIYI